jgi:hypothetical protein
MTLHDGSQYVARGQSVDGTGRGKGWGRERTKEVRKWEEVSAEVEENPLISET